METYVVLLRGINVGGKNRVPMAALKECLQGIGFANVSTYIASGNAILESDKNPDRIRILIERALPETFALDDQLVRALVLTRDQLRSVVRKRPKGFGDQPKTFHSDVVFLMGIAAAQAMPVFSPREGIDKIWPGDGVIYSQRLSARRTKSRLNRIMATPEYKLMTIRSWSTTTKLFELSEEGRP